MIDGGIKDGELSNNNNKILQFLQFGFKYKQKLKQKAKPREKSCELLLQGQCFLLYLLIKMIFQPINISNIYFIVGRLQPYLSKLLSHASLYQYRIHPSFSNIDLIKLSSSMKLP